MNASPKPINACTVAIAGRPNLSGDVPESASSNAVATAPTSTESQPPKNAANNRDLAPSPNNLRETTYTVYPVNAVITPMLSIFQPIASSPPS